MGVVGYNGGRRGGAEDVIRRPGENQLPATVAAQALAAFHGRPDVAYHRKGQIWEADAIYSDVFPERTRARHILYTYSLLKAIEQQKLVLAAKAEADRTQNDRTCWDGWDCAVRRSWLWRPWGQSAKPSWASQSPTSTRFDSRESSPWQKP